MKWKPIDSLKFKYKAAVIYILISVAVKEIDCRQKSLPKLPQHFKNQWIDAVIPQLQELQPNQVTIFSDNIRKPSRRYEKEKVKVINQLARRISNFSSVVVIDMDFLDIPSENRALDSPYLKFVNNSTLFLMIHELEKPETVKDIQKPLLFFIKIASGRKGPKILGINLITRFKLNDKWPRLQVKAAWTYVRMMDYSILSVTETASRLYTYNLFDNAHLVSKFNSSVRIFPDKVASLRKHEVRHYDLLDDRMKNNKIQIYGRFSPITFMDRQFVYNLTVRVDKDVFDIDHLAKKYSLLPPRLVVKSPLSYTSFIAGVVAYSAIVPVEKRNHRFEIPVDILIQLATFFAVIGIYVVIAIIFKFPREAWTYENLYLIMLGYSAFPSLRRLTEKIIYLSVVALSLTLASDLICSVTEIGFVSDTFVFDTWRKISAADYKIFFYLDDFKLLLFEDHKYLENVPEKNIRISGNVIKDCVLLMRKYDRACVLNVQQIDIVVMFRSVAEKLRLPEFEYVEGSLHEFMSFFVFHPFIVNLIDEINRKYFNLFETGHTYDFHDVSQRYKEKYGIDKLDDSFSGLNAIPLIIVMTVGFVSASVVFILEIFGAHASKNRYDQIIMDRARTIKNMSVKRFKLMRQNSKNHSKGHPKNHRMDKKIEESEIYDIN